MFAYPESAWRFRLTGAEAAGAGAGAGAGAAGAGAAGAGAAGTGEGEKVEGEDWRRLEEGLNRLKTGLERYQRRPEELRRALASLDPYAEVREEVGRRLGLKRREATNATLKLLELAEAAGVPAPGETRAFCNAELPGAFVRALEALHEKRGASLDWVASSLYPEGGAELGDSAGVYRRNRGRWLMGPPPNGIPEELGKVPPLRGDVTSAEDVAGLALAVRLRFGARGGANLYTSDAGTDVAADPNAAEAATAWLHFGQTACGLLALAPGGAFVAKTYTFFRPESRALLELLGARFESLELVKPLASRAANSEVYVVGRGYRGCPPELRERLLGALRGRRPGAPPPCLAEASPEGDRKLYRAAAEVHGSQQGAFLAEAAARAAARRRGADPAHPPLQKAWLEKRGLP
jgi:hypothetical protein